MNTTPDTQLTSSLEDYLEAILFLIRRGRVARVRDIAKRVGVGMSSVTAALRALSKRGLVNYDPYQVITLTDAGREVAERIAQRHDVLRRFLTDVLGLDRELADTNACRMEHSIDADVLERLRDFAEFLRTCPRAGEDWTAKFLTFCSRQRSVEQCRQCLETLRAERMP